MTDSRRPEPGSGESKSLWGGRFRGGMATEMIPLNRSLGVDYRAAIRCTGGVNAVGAVSSIYTELHHLQYQCNG